MRRTRPFSGLSWCAWFFGFVGGAVAALGAGLALMGLRRAIEGRECRGDVHAAAGEIVEVAALLFASAWWG